MEETKWKTRKLHHELPKGTIRILSKQEIEETNKHYTDIFNRELHRRKYGK